VTYPKELNETIGNPIQVEPLKQTQLEEIGLNTCSHNLSLSSREFSSVNDPEPQPLLNFPSLDLYIRNKKSPDRPINPYSQGSFKMKVIDPLTIHTPPSPHVAYFHPKGVYCYYHLHLILSVGKTSLIFVK
jgi:hypothetical protein